jgi:hypothetical protein
MNYTAGRLHISRQKVTDALVSVSLANLCLLRVWVALLLGRASQYYAKLPYNRNDYIAVFANLAVLAILFFAITQVARSGRNHWFRALAKIAFLSGLVPVFDFVRRYLDIGYGGFLHYGLSVFIIGMIIIGLMVFRWRKALYKYAYLGVLFSIPFTVVTVLQASWSAVQNHWQQAPLVPSNNGAKLDGAAAKSRVIWVIFDEWDQAALFDKRPVRLQLPHIDAFVRNALVATNAYPPGGETLISLPSLMTGCYLTKLQAIGYDLLKVQTTIGSTAEDFRTLPNIFTESAKSGMRIAIAGWLHPYSRLIGYWPNVSVHWEVAHLLQGFRGEGIIGTAVKQLRYIFTPTLLQEEAVNTFSRIHSFARGAIRDPKIDLVFLHYPIPHMPGIYDPETLQVSLQIESVPESYYSNLILTDRVLAELLEDLEASGSRKNTTIILSSDHWWRVSQSSDGIRDHRIPLMIKMGWLDRPMTFTKRINTVDTASVVRDLLNGKINDYPDLLRHFHVYDGQAQFIYRDDGIMQAIPGP